MSRQEQIPYIELLRADSQIVYAILDNKYDVLAGGGFKKSVNAGASLDRLEHRPLTVDSRQVNSIATPDRPRCCC